MSGVSTDKVVISWNDYSGTPLNNPPFTGQETWVLQKSDLLAASAVRYYRFSPDVNRFRLVPAQSLTATQTEWLAYNKADCTLPDTCNTSSPTVGGVAI